MTMSEPNNKIYQTLVDGLQGIEILAPGIEGYEDSIKRWSEAVEKRAVRCKLENPHVHDN
jgi:hypothetical protein